MAKTVFVGVSGGVDSAVSAALLKQQGYDVTCVFIKIWQPEFIECSWKEDRIDAIRIAVSLGLPFMEVDLSDEYNKTVVRKMVKDYASGITPNPDVLCNRTIKFGSFLKFARENGADFIATGHYARVAFGDRRLSRTNRRFTQKKSKKEFELLRGRDKEKDQSYFLYLLDQSDLAFTLFPVGNLLKSEVREFARRFELPVADKPDSQGLCFVGEVTLPDFLRQYIKLEKGAVRDKSGAMIGEHDGAALYTIGQRHGFSIANKKTRRGDLSAQAGPYYVTGIDIKKNVLYASRDLGDAKRKEIEIDKMHWISMDSRLPGNFDVQARYREKPSRTGISKKGNRIRVRFEEPHIISPGQSLVIYDGIRCLGGGIIK